MNGTKRAELKKQVLEIINTPPPEDMDEAFLDAPEAFDSAYARAVSKQKGYEIEGFKFLSAATGGLNPNGFSIICGPTGKGKTTLLANLWMQFRNMSLPTFTAPVENGKEDFIDILVSIALNRSRLQMDSSIWVENKKVIKETIFADRRNVFSNHESRLSHLDLLTDIYYAWKTKGCKIALCDNWQFMQELKAGKDAMVESDKNLHEMVVFCKHVPVHIFMVMHPKKTENERVNSIFDIKGSSNSVQEAHNIWLFNTLKDADDCPPLTPMEYCREITVGKARYNGRAVGAKIVYALDPVSELYKEYKVL